MKKVFYNKYAKLFEIVCILVAVCIVLFDCIQIADAYKSRGEEESLLKEDIIDYYEMSEDMFKELSPYLNSLILAHEKGGMEGVEALVEGDTEKWDRIYVTVADSQYIYYDGLTPHSIEKRYWYVGETERIDKAYEKVGYEIENYDFSFGCTVHLKEDIVYTLYNKTAEEPKQVISVGYAQILDEESIKYLESIKGGLRISFYTTFDYIQKIEKERWNIYYEKLEQQQEVHIEELVIDWVPRFAVCGVVILFATVLLIISCGRCVDGKKELNNYETEFTESHLLFITVLVTALIYGALTFFTFYEEIPYASDSEEIKIINASFVAVMLLAIFGVYFELGVIVKKIINKRFFKDWLIVKLLIKLKNWCVKKINKVKSYLAKNYDASAYAALPSIKRAYIRKIITDVLVTIICIVLFITGVVIPLEYYTYDDLFYSVGIVIGLLLITYYTGSFFGYMKLRDFNRVVDGINTIYNGNYTSVKVEPDEKCEEMLKLADLSHSFKESVRKQVEAEKMQVELIANVSHDLKTPLTSIISYVDLLKEEEMTDVAKEYVKVLIDKSARLKDIVADVFDLAKATSGEQIMMEQLDGVVLINQVLSDMSDKIEETGKDLRIKLQNETAPIMGNGQKLYRVFQNVIDNALKYSMPGTRIYLGTEFKGGEFVVTIKNVSQFEIDYTSEEIMSRFTRGDKARHSEGNGLGLSIAKSFTELCGGSFEVKLDDDIFMVIIRLR